MRKEISILVIVVGLLLLFGNAGDLFKSSLIQFSESNQHFANVEPMECNGVMTRWVSDLDQDGFPDLVVAFQPRSILPEWIPFELSERELDWEVFILSGLNGKKISHFDLAIDQLQIRDALSHVAEVEELELVAGMNFWVGMLVSRGGVRPLPGLSGHSPAIACFTGKIPIMVFEDDDCFHIQELQSVNPKYTKLSIETSSSVPLGTVDVKRFFVLGESPILSGLLPECFFENPGDPEPVGIRNMLHSWAIESGTLQSKFELEDVESENFRPRSLVGHYDQNGDGQKDWLVENSRDKGGRWRWFDGNSGSVLKEASSNWKLPVFGGFQLEDLSVPTDIGLIYLAKSTTPSREFSLFLRDWKTGIVQWEIRTPFDFKSFGSSVKVTEFEDMDRDGVADVGITVVLEAKPSGGRGWNDDQFHAQCMLVSGKTGLPIQHSDLSHQTKE